MRMVKGGSRVLEKGGGGQQIEMTVHVMVPSTGLWPVDATPFGVAEGWFGGGDPLHILEKK